MKKQLLVLLALAIISSLLLPSCSSGVNTISTTQEQTSTQAYQTATEEDRLYPDLPEMDYEGYHR